MTRMPTVTEHSPRDVDNACAKLVGKEMEEAALMSTNVSHLRTTVTRRQSA